MDFKYKIADVAKEFGMPAKKVVETVSGVTGEASAPALQSVTRRNRSAGSVIHAESERRLMMRLDDIAERCERLFVECDATVDVFHVQRQMVQHGLGRPPLVLVFDCCLQCKPERFPQGRAWL